MGRPVRWYDYLTINIFYLGQTTLAQAIGLITPLLVQDFVGEELKGTLFGNLRLWSLMVALLIQAGFGAISDRSASRWGRRRPFIFLGTFLNLLFISAIGFSLGMEGESGYWFLFSTVLMIQLSSNIALSAQQGLIPDLVPEATRGRFSGVKATLELPIPLLFVAFTVAQLVNGGNIWGGLIVTAGLLVTTMAITMFVPEKPITDLPPPVDWAPFLRLLAMTATFTAIILGMGEFIQISGRLMATLESTPAMLVLTGLVGLSAMLVAIGLGVWFSIRIGLGRTARDHQSFTWWVVNRLAYLVGVVNLSTFAIFFLQARLGYVREKAAGPGAILMLIVGVSVLIFALPSGWLADRFGHKKLVVFSGFIAASGTLIALVIPNLTTIFIGGSLIGAATGVFYTANWALGTELVPKAEAASFLGIANLAGAGAGAVGAYLGGPIADFFTRNVPDSPDLGYILLFSIYGILFLVSIFAINRVETPGKDSRREDYALP